MSSHIVKVGTRGSFLALTQTRTVIQQLSEKNPELQFELVIINTAGDIDRVTALDKIGGAGLFTKKIEQELLAGNIDIAVHSAKDLPSVMTAGLTLGAVPVRLPGEDAWLSRDGMKLTEVPSGTVVGTGSPRRQAQLRYLRPDLEVHDIRGNVETRLRKMKEGPYQAILMARAGLARAGFSGKITEILDPEKFVPAPGQGALAVQIRAGDLRLRAVTAPLDDPCSRRTLTVERSLLARLQAGCSTPVGGQARLENGHLSLTAVLLDIAGKTRLFVSHHIDESQPDDVLLERVVNELLSQGAKELLAGYHG
ncbi:MAG: hydroxymethylbilane synthase [Candidatus Zixiibacteriota bacterium]